MFRRIKRAAGLAVRVGVGSVMGAVTLPMVSILRKRGEFAMAFEPTCYGAVFTIYVGPPCEHDEGDEGPARSSRGDGQQPHGAVSPVSRASGGVAPVGPPTRLAIMIAT